MWEFLSDAATQTTLAFYGGGIAAVAAGLWKAWTGLRRKPPPTPPAGRQVSARDGVAAGGDVLIEGDVNVTRSEMPKGAIAWLAAGVVLLGLGAFLTGGDRMDRSIKAGGDIDARDITINGAGEGAD